MNVTQRTFAGGELGPALYARTDLQKYATGLRTCRNFVVQKHGGVSNRPGTEYVASVKDSTYAPRLIPFEFNDQQTYVLEMGDGYFRWFTDGGQLTVTSASAWGTSTAYGVADLVTDGGVYYYCTVAHTSGATTEPGVGTSWQSNWYAFTSGIYEIPSPYTSADLDAIQYVQSADVVTLVHPSYAPRELQRYGNTDWRLTTISFGPAIDAPTSVGVTGGVAGSDTYYAVTALAEASDEESLAGTATLSAKTPDAGTPAVVTWLPVTGAVGYNIYRSTDQSTYGFIGTAGGQRIAATQTTWTTASNTLSTTTGGSWQVSGGQARVTVLSAAADRAYDGRYTIRGTLTVSASGGSPTLTRGRIGIYYKRGSETRVFADYTDTVNVVGASSLSFDFETTITVPDNSYTTLQLDLVPEVYGAGTLTPTFVCTVDETSAPQNSVSWSKIALQFSDAAIAINYAIAPPSQPTRFQSASNYPSAVGYYQQRIAYANTTTSPEDVWLSRVGSYHSFADSTPIQDDDPVTFRLAGRKVNSVRHLVDLGKLLIGTLGGIWRLEGDQAGSITPSAINARQLAYNGMASLSPVLFASTMLYVQARGTLVRDLSLTTDGGYTGRDLTLYAPHLFEGYTIADWAYAETPHSVVWAVRSDGTLLGLTYLPEQDVWGWHRHDTDGAFERVCVIPEGTEDRAYVVVQRTVNNATVRYVERMAVRTASPITDAMFLDASLSYDGTNTSATTMTLSGGTAWTYDETLTLRASTSTFGSGDIGNAIVFTAADGTIVRVRITAYTSGTVVSGKADKTVPVDLRSSATAVWAKAVDTLSGLSHLEGKVVSVIGDGFVVASPNNPAYPTVTVSSGSITLGDVYSVIHVGLPYLSDLETLDIDQASGPSLKERKMQIGRVGVFVQDSRGIWTGRAVPTGSDATAGLSEAKLRTTESLDEPTRLQTDEIEVDIDTTWDSNGRIVVRQVDPLPLTILAVRPTGFLPPVA